jgi:hypothetical protein
MAHWHGGFCQALRASAVNDADVSCEITTQPADADSWWIDYVLSSRWVTIDSQIPLTVNLTGGDEVEIGDYKTSRRALIAARPGACGTLLEFCCTHDGWRVLPLKLYRPLVYYAAFGSDDIFGCLRAALVSLLAIGKWDNDIAILTRLEDVAKVNAAVADLDLGIRLQIITVPGIDILDWCLARYRIDAAEIFATHQPIIYLDVDVICDSPLNDFCLQLTHCPTIEIVPEGRLDEGHPESSGQWFGWRLMAADAMAFSPSEPGFSSGILGFANKQVAQHAFSAILRSAGFHAEQCGTRHRFAGYDQPFAGYVMKKLGVMSSILLPEIARLCRVDPVRTPLPMPARPAGLAHFHGIVGDAASKRRAMEHYLVTLAAR